MQIKDIMTPSVRTVSPTDTLRDAALIMAEADIGALPVAEGDRLTGMVTDRDIAIRGVALGKHGDAAVSEVMSNEVLYCFNDESAAAVSSNMGDLQVRRLPVLDRDKRLVGIVSLADLACSADTESAGEALGAITRPGGEHSQVSDTRM
ncbi:MAG: CBS domain-containing protein [Terricaulis sp.]